MVAAKARKAVEDLDHSSERILAQLTRIAFSDIRDLYAKDGTLLPVHKWPDGVAAAIAAVETEEIPATQTRVRTVIRKVKRTDQVRCLELLGKYRKLFTDMSESTVKVTLEDLVAGE